MEFDLLDVTRAAAWLVYNYYYVDSRLRLACSYTADMNDLVDPVYGYQRKQAADASRALYLLDLAQQRLATNPVDKLYGILGLATNTIGETPLSIVPDYGKPIRQVFRDATWCLARAGDISFLDYVRHRPSEYTAKSDGFPSWVPKWHVSKDLDKDPNFMSLLNDASLKRQSSAPTLNLVEPSDVLTVDGVRVDRIRSTTERMTASDLQSADILRSVLSQVQDMVAKCCHGLDDTTSLASTLVAGVDVNCKPVSTDISLGYHALIHQVYQDQSMPLSVSSLRRDSGVATIAASQYHEAMCTACMNRSFSITRGGRLGLVPYFSRRGDIIAVLNGLKFPVVLRPFNKGYSFLGTCFMQWIMSGEAFHGSEEKDIFEIL
jgi:hypothetical protein